VDCFIVKLVKGTIPDMLSSYFYLLYCCDPTKKLAFQYVVKVHIEYLSLLGLFSK